MRVTYDPRDGVITWAGQEARLSRQVGRVFAALARRPGRIVTHDELEAVIDPDGRLALAYGQVSVLIFHLRRQLARLGCPLHIRCQHRIGYRLTEPVEIVGDTIVLGEGATRLVRRLIEVCPSKTLAEQARQAVFG